MSNWNTYLIAELAAPTKNALATGPFGSAISSKKFVSEGVPVIRGSNLSVDVGKRIIDDEIVFVSEVDAGKFSRSIATIGDLVFTCWGTIGQVGFIDSSSRFEEYVVSNKQMKLTPNPELVDSLFLYYAMSSPDSIQEMQSMSIGSSVPGFNLSQLRQLRINIPPLREQLAIVEILGALDDKITVNDRIAGTGRELGLSMFRQAVLREGSVFSSIGEVALLVSRGVAPKYAEGPDTLMVLNQRCIRNGFVNTTPSRRTLESKASQQKRLQRNDVLVNSTGVGTLGRVARWTSHAVATVDSHVSIVRFDPAKIDPVCAGYAMLAAEPEFELLGEGSTGQTELKRVQLQEYDIAIPPVSYQGELGKSLEALENRIAQAFIESASLAELRDTLLPRLMSGELRVKDAERIVEDVT